jgi:hypothetical protein
MAIKVFIDPPSRGWISVTLDFFENGRFDCAASDTPNDFLGELVYSIYRVLQLGGSCSAFAHTEPGAYEFAFSSSNPEGNISLEIIEHADLMNSRIAAGNSLMIISGEDNTLCHAFLFAIKQLAVDMSESEFRSKSGWAWSFPDAGLYNLKLLLEGWPKDSI